MSGHRIGTPEEWRSARVELLAAEKELTRRSDELAVRRRALPWVPVEKDYRFEAESGTVSLADLFQGRRELIVHHVMYAPDWDAACEGCSFTIDHIDGGVAHLEAAGVSFVAVSRAPWAKLRAYKERMGWSIRWVSSGGSDFNYDFGVSFTPEQQANGAGYNYREIQPRESDSTGLSSFVIENGIVHHTYSAYHRGTDILGTTWQLLDRAPIDHRSPSWMKRHDEYETAASR